VSIISRTNKPLSKYDAYHLIDQIRSEYIDQRAVFVPGKIVESILKFLGVDDLDLADLKAANENLKSDPTLPFRLSRNGRFISDSANLKTYSGVQQPFVLTASEDFVRHDSGQRRIFEPLTQGLTNNRAFRELLALKMAIVSDVPVRERVGLDYESTRSITTVFSLRTVSTPEQIGEPAMEGVHSDGVDHTMTVFLAADNLTELSGITRLHDIGVSSGIDWRAVLGTDIIDQVRHSNFLDTLIVVDNERKHSVTALFPQNVAITATRDMLIFFTRKPVVSAHPSEGIDSIAIAPDSRTMIDWWPHRHAARAVAHSNGELQRERRLSWHEGACHCERVKFRVALTDNLTITECNCGICYKSGHRELLVEESRFELLVGRDCLKEYRFGAKTADHTFCAICGVMPFYRPRSNPEGFFSVNARCIDISFARDVEFVPFDGQNWEASITAGKHRTTE
jgi:hypothetical protein